MFGLGTMELLIILVVIVVLFGAGRVSKIMGEMGAGVKAFKEGMQDGEASHMKTPPKKRNTTKK